MLREVQKKVAPLNHFPPRGTLLNQNDAMDTLAAMVKEKLTSEQKLSRLRLRYDDWKNLLMTTFSQFKAAFTYFSTCLFTTHSPPRTSGSTSEKAPKVEQEFTPAASTNNEPRSSATQLIRTLSVEDDELKELLDSIKLRQFYEKFVEQGFDDLDSLRKLTPPQWKVMVESVGLQPGHEMRLQEAIGETPNVESSCCVVQ